MNCIFCAIVTGVAPAAVVYEDDETLAFMDINPVSRGHVLVVTKEHYRNLFDVDPKAAAAVMRTTVRVARAVQSALQPDGMNLFQSNERAAFQSVFHFHVHIIPRWIGDELRLPPRVQRTEFPVLQEIAARICEHLTE
jgi:histidine triad (HIT) family protein